MNLNAALLGHPKHIFYLTGFASNLNPWQVAMKGPRCTSFLLVDSDGGAHLLVGDSEVSNAFTKEEFEHARSFDGEISTYADYKLDERMITYGDVLSRENAKWLRGLASRGVKMDRLGTEEWFIPQVQASAIARALKDSKMTGISEVMMRMRRTKGRDEMESVREAVKLTDKAFKIARENVRPRISETRLYGAIDSALGSQLWPYGSVVGDYVSGERTLNVDGGPTDRKLERGETVILDLHICRNQYWSDLCRTFVVGRPSGGQNHVLDTLMRAKEKAEELLVPGTRCSEIYETVSTTISSAGFPKLPHHAGHGLGLDAQEPPAFLPASGETLEEGMICVIEPGIYTPETGGVRIEDCYIIGSNGHTKISRYPIRL